MNIFILLLDVLCFVYIFLTSSGCEKLKPSMYDRIYSAIESVILVNVLIISVWSVYLIFKYF